MDVNTLRSQLQYFCQSLQNLTTAELSECKWPTKKKIYVDLLSQVPSVSEEYSRLESLLDARNVEVGSQRASNESRDSRMETERLFRTNFLSIVLQCLKHLRWPPSMEAFSDPMNDLFHDTETAFSAFAHLMRVGIPQHIPVGLEAHARSPPPSTSNSRPSSAVSMHGSPQESIHSLRLQGQPSSSKSSVRSKSTVGGSKSVTGVRHDAPGDISIVSRSSASYAQLDASRQTEDYSMDSARSVNTTASKAGSRNVPSRMSDIDDRSRATGAGNSRMSTSGVSIGSAAQYSQRRGSIGTGTAPNGGSDSQWNIVRALEVMQYQNEMLTKQLKQLQEAVCARQDIEQRMETLMLDFKSVVDQAIETSPLTSKFRKMEGTSADPSIPKPPSPSLPKRLTPSEEESYLREIARVEAEAKLAMSQAGMRGVSHAKPIANSSVGASATNAKRSQQKHQPVPDVGSSLGAAATKGKASNDGPNIVDPPATPPVVGSRSDQPSSSSNSVTPLQFTQLKKTQAAMGSLLEGWNQARKRARSCVLDASLSVMDESMPFCAGSQLAADSSKPIDIKIHQLLGVKPSLARTDYSNNINNSSEGGYVTSMGLNLQRVHVLQRDLLGFAHHASEFLTRLQSTSELPPQSVDNSPADLGIPAFPLTLDAAKARHAMEQLRIHAENLILHLACVAPLAPIIPISGGTNGNNNAHLSSEYTGLEMLLNEVSTILSSKGLKQYVSKIQLAGDRARSEQAALVRCLQQSRDSLKRWPQAGLATAEALKTFASRYKLIFEKSVKEISRLKHASNGLLTAYGTAAQARVPSIGPDSTRKTLVCPLDQLGRGTHGVEMASLVNALKVYFDEIENADTLFASISERLASETTVELDALNDLTKQLKRAALTMQQKHL